LHDDVLPYLIPDKSIYRWIDDAYREFVARTGGIPDTSSPVALLQATAGEEFSELSPLILRIQGAWEKSTGYPIRIVNATDLARWGEHLTPRTGRVHMMVLGLEPDRVRWSYIPQQDTEVRLHIFRLPEDEITGAKQDLDEVADQYHLGLLHWVKHHAYLSPDTDFFDRRAAETHEKAFDEHCTKAKNEMERRNYKPRVVRYGGL
jgi:hypothetical protein